MKALLGLCMAFGGWALAYAGPLASFIYGVYLMFTEGFLFGLLVSTFGALSVLGVGLVVAVCGAAMLED